MACDYAESMPDRITKITVEGLRAIDHSALDLDGLCCVIGENGSGKSSLIEAFALLRLAATEGPEFAKKLAARHRFPAALLRSDRSTLALTVRIEDERDVIDYRIECAVDARRGYPDVRERVSRQDGSSVDEGPLLTFFEGTYQAASQIGPIAVRSSLSPERRALRARIATTLAGIEVHTASGWVADWVADAQGLARGGRGSAPIVPVERVDTLSSNLATAFHHLRGCGDAVWRETNELVQLALGESVVEVVPKADFSSQVSLMVRLRDPSTLIPASSLAAGMLQWLSLVAIAKLNGDRSVAIDEQRWDASQKRTALLFDEPDMHAHPQMQARVAQLFAEIARVEEIPVIVAVHGDRFIDAIDDPSRHVVLASRARSGALLRPSPVELERWLDEYRSISAVRAAGAERSVFTKVAS